MLHPESVADEKSPFHQLTPVLANKRRKVVRTPVGVEKVTVIGGGMAGKTW
jgi:hypothetical protein